MYLFNTLGVVLCSLSTVTAYSKVNRVTDSSLLFQYNFAEGQTNPSATTTADSVTTNYLGSLNVQNIAGCAQWMNQAVGISLQGSCSSAAIVSPNTFASAMSHITNAGGWTWEAWFQPMVGWNSTSSGVGEQNIMFGIGNWNISNTVDPQWCYVLQNTHFNNATLFFSEAQSQIYTLAKENTNGGTNLTCQSVSGGMVNANSVAGIHHVVATSTAAAFNFYMDGVLQNTAAFAADVTTWNASHYLQFSPAHALSTYNYDDTKTWEGSVMLVAMYNRPLNATEVLQNYNARNPNSAPYFNTTTSTITCPSTIACTNVTLQLNSSGAFAAYDRDNDIQTGYIFTLPSKGTLSIYNTNTQQTTTITTVPTAFPNNSAGLYLTYTSNPYDYGTSYASFTYKLFDGAAYSLNTQNVTINILQPVIQPANNWTYALNTTIQHPTILTATATQNNAAVNHVGTALTPFVAMLPTYGTLYQYNTGTNTVSNAITTVNTTITDTYWRVWYISNDGPVVSNLNQATVLPYPNEQLQLSVQNGPNIVTNALYNISVATKLNAIGCTINITPTSNTNITVPITVTSLVNEVVYMKLVSLPQMGNIYKNGIQLNITGASVAWTQGTDALTYTSTQNFSDSSQPILPDGFKFAAQDATGFSTPIQSVATTTAAITIVRSNSTTALTADSNEIWFPFQLVVCDQTNMLTCVGVTPQSPYNSANNMSMGVSTANGGTQYLVHIHASDSAFLWQGNPAAANSMYGSATGQYSIAAAGENSDGEFVADMPTINLYFSQFQVRTYIQPTSGLPYTLQINICRQIDNGLMTVAKYQYTVTNTEAGSMFQPSVTLDFLSVPIGTWVIIAPCALVGLCLMCFMYRRYKVNRRKRETQKQIREQGEQVIHAVERDTKAKLDELQQRTTQQSSMMYMQPVPWQQYSMNMSMPMSGMSMNGMIPMSPYGAPMYNSMPMPMPMPMPTGSYQPNFNTADTQPISTAPASGISAPAYPVSSPEPVSPTPEPADGTPRRRFRLFSTKELPSTPNANEYDSIRSAGGPSYVKVGMKGSNDINNKPT